MMTKLRLYILVALSLLAAQSAGATEGVEYVTSRIFGSQENKFPSVHISDIVEDTHGYLWIATPNGLTRFDGIRFTTLQHTPGSSFGLPGNSISCMSPSSHGGVYAAVINNGLCYIDRSGDVTSFGEQVDPSIESVRIVPDVSMVESGENLWFLTTSRALNVWRRNESGESRTFFDSSASLEYPSKVLGVAADGRGGVYIAAGESGVWKATPQADVLTPLFNPFSDRENTSVHSIAMHDNVVVAGGKGVVAFSMKDGDSVRYVDVSFDVETDKALVRDIQRTEDGLWLFLVEQTGLVYADPSGHAQLLFSYQQMQTVLGSGGTMQSFLAASSGNLYVGMSTGLIELYRVAQGVQNVNLENQSFQDAHDGMASFRGVTVWNDSIVFAGTRQGLVEIHNNDVVAMYRPMRNKKGAGEIVNTVCKWDSVLVLGTNAGIFVFDPHTKSYEGVNVPYAFVMGTWALEPLSDSTLLVGTLGAGAYVLNMNSYAVTPFPSGLQGLQHSSLSNDVVVSMKTIGDNVWIGTDNGVHVYNKKSGELDLVYHSSNQELPIYPVWDIVPWRGAVIFGTAGGGLLQFRATKEGGTVTVLASEGKGLPSNIVRCVLVDEQQRLWVSTDKGISIFDELARPQLTLLANRDVSVAEFNFKSSSKKNGTLYFGGHGGLVSIDANEIRFPSRSVYSVLSEFEAYGTDSVVLCLAPGADTLRIDHDFNSFSLSPSVLRTPRPDIAHWFVQIHGLDKTPRVNRNTDPTMYYANVSPGVYEVEMTAYMQNGQMASMGSPLFVEVVPAVWQTIWFRYSIGTLAVLLVVSPLVVWLMASRKRQKLQERLVEMHLSALRSQMNPHFVYNVLNSIVGYIVRGKKEEAIDYISDFAALMRIVLENSRKSLITLESELAALQQYLDLEAQRHNHSFTFSIVCLKGLDPSTVKMPSMLIQPFVENSIKHGVVSRENGRVSVLISRKDALRWQCVIEDNGIGIERSLARKRVETHTSRGLEINSERVSALRSLYGDYFSIEVTPAVADKHAEFVGTRVTLTFPILSMENT